MISHKNLSMAVRDFSNSPDNFKRTTTSAELDNFFQFCLNSICTDLVLEVKR